MIPLAEYHLATGDKSVLPALEAYALTMARGQDGAGIGGHRLATKNRNGRLPGYAHITGKNADESLWVKGALLRENVGRQRGRARTRPHRTVFQLPLESARCQCRRAARHGRTFPPHRLASRSLPALGRRLRFQQPLP